MSVGNQPSVNQLNSQVSALALAIRNDLRNAMNFNQYVIALGLAGLEAVGFSSEANPDNPGSASDAAYLLTLASYMNTIAEVYYGSQGQATPGQTAVSFDFDNGLCSLWTGN
jgi:hypothetical protein